MRLHGWRLAAAHTPSLDSSMSSRAGSTTSVMSTNGRVSGLADGAVLALCLPDKLRLAADLPLDPSMWQLRQCATEYGVFPLISPFVRENVRAHARASQR
jgi:hypothetical protein